MYKERLLTPGPTPIPLRVMQAMERPQLHHRSEVFKKELIQASEGLKWALGWDSSPIFLACSGTGAMEASLLNCLTPGDEIITVNAGSFGSRWRAIGERLGLRVHELILEWGQAASAEDCCRMIEQHPRAKAFCIQHSETSTTVLHPVESILRAVKKISSTIVTIVDGISACMTTPIPGDPSTIDIYIAGSQKAFMLPPGLSMLALSKHAWEVAEKTPKRSLYFDLCTERESLKHGETSWTPASTLIVGLNTALDIMREEGLSAVYERHLAMSAMARRGLAALGCTIVAPTAPCPAVTGFFPPNGLEADTLRSEVRKHFGIRLAGGQGKFTGKIVRIGHMGYIDLFEVMNAISAIGITARSLGTSVDIHQALKECAESLTA